MKTSQFTISLIGTLIMIYVMQVTGAPLKGAETPLGILNLEFAYNAQLADLVTNAWKQQNVLEDAIYNTALDFIFLGCYSILLFSICSYISKKSIGMLRKMGSGFGIAVLIAGGLDILKNLGMLITLSGAIDDSIALMTVIFSILKWVLVLTVIVFVLIAGPIAFFRKNQLENS
ncbi:MAG: hypothetical protein ACOYKE_06230 [Ferruginibacter sp.]